ncbi:MAG: hypothetical protein J5I94_24360 [Phaeodactylibacter sp.]|nr:hypothetical protein [Phaeodactylibacter sp.]
MEVIKVDPTEPIPRAIIYEKLEEQVRAFENHNDFVYKHGDPEVIEKVFESGDEQSAIKRAEVLDKHFGKTGPIRANPSTKIFKVIRLLRELIAFYNWEPN